MDHVFLHLGLAVTSALLGAVLWHIGRSRRTGKSLHCRTCDYNLTGTVSAACPECGKDWKASGTVTGESNPNRALVILGWAIFIPSGFGVFLSMVEIYGESQGRLYHLRPTILILSDLNSADSNLYDRSANELNNRLQTGRLSDGDRRRATKLLLKRLVSAMSPTPRRGDRGTEAKSIAFLSSQFAAGELTPSESEIFLDCAVGTAVTIVDQRFRLTCMTSIGSGVDIDRLVVHHRIRFPASSGRVAAAQPLLSSYRAQYKRGFAWQAWSEAKLPTEEIREGPIYVDATWFLLDTPATVASSGQQESQASDQLRLAEMVSKPTTRRIVEYTREVIPVRLSQSNRPEKKKPAHTHP